MSDVFIALMLAFGVGGWVYSKVDRRTGGSVQRSLSTASIAAILAFMAMITTLNLIPS